MCLPRPYCVDNELHDSATRLLTYTESALDILQTIREHYHGQKDEQISKFEQPLQKYIIDDSPEHKGSSQDGEYDFRDNDCTLPAFHGHRP